MARWSGPPARRGSAGRHDLVFKSSSARGAFWPRTLIGTSAFPVDFQRPAPPGVCMTSLNPSACGMSSRCCTGANERWLPISDPRPCSQDRNAPESGRATRAQMPRLRPRSRRGEPRPGRPRDGRPWQAILLCGSAPRAGGLGRRARPSAGLPARRLARPGAISRATAFSTVSFSKRFLAVGVSPDDPSIARKLGPTPFPRAGGASALRASPA